MDCIICSMEQVCNNYIIKSVTDTLFTGISLSYLVNISISNYKLMLVFNDDLYSKNYASSLSLK
jgi:hypothetical protein